MFRTNRNHRPGALLTTLAMLLLLVTPVFAAETAVTMRLTRAEGTVNVVNASGRDVTVREKMRLYGGYSIKTGTNSYAWIALDDSKLVKVDTASEVEVRKNGKNMELLLSSGNIFFNVTEPLEEDENLNICTSSMIAGIRGTSGWVSLKNSRSGLGVLEGRVLCTTVENSVWVESGQLTSFHDNGEIVSEEIDLEETPGFVLTEVVTDPALCAEIMEASGLDIASITPDQAAARQAADEVLTAQAVEAVQKALAQQSGSGMEQSRDDSGSDSSGPGGGSGPAATPVEPVKPEEPSKEQEESKEKPGKTVVPFKVSGGENGTDYFYSESDRVLTILTATPLTISNTENTPTNSRIEVSSYEGDNIEGANITLAGVNIEISEDTEAAAFLIPNAYQKNVTITLADGTENVLKSGVNCAGLQKNDDCGPGLLTIQGDGSLTATGGYGGAGIGGGASFGGHSRNIMISGGKVTATGGGMAAGIGGGNNGNGTNITISNADVTATGDMDAAGIGGGCCGSGADIRISGSEVTATGGAGIGGGNSYNGTNIEISDSTVTAAADFFEGAGIGGGCGGNGEQITIHNSTVKATGNGYAAGIGGGYLGDGIDITIEDGSTVEATCYMEHAESGGDGYGYGAGIGGGYSGNGGQIKISNSTVTAISGYGAGIGGGIGGNGEDITITGGIVEAASTDAATAGIGSGDTIIAEVDDNAFVYIKTGKADPLTPSYSLTVVKGIVFYPDLDTIPAWGTGTTTDIEIFGLVVGDVTLNASADIPNCTKLTISENSKLTIQENVELKIGESAALDIKQGGSIDGIVLDSNGAQLYPATRAMMAMLPEEPEAELPPTPDTPPEPEAPEKPDDPSEPEVPVEPENPAEPVNPAIPDPSAGPGEPAEPEDGKEPNPPAEPENSGGDTPSEADTTEPGGAEENPEQQD